jgi:hypothetical protein
MRINPTKKYWDEVAMEQRAKRLHLELRAQRIASQTHVSAPPNRLCNSLLAIALICLALGMLVITLRGHL